MSRRRYHSIMSRVHTQLQAPLRVKLTSISCFLLENVPPERVKLTAGQRLPPSKNRHFTAVYVLFIVRLSMLNN